jgi:hypothetical protein
MIWGNVDAFHGFTSPQFNASEVPTGLVGNGKYVPQIVFQPQLPASNTLPASFFYSSKPSWWPALKAWPIVGPDVTGGNVSGVNGTVYTNPAEDCYLNVMGGAANGEGAVLAFSANACYSASGGPSFSASPSIVPANHSGHITLTLTGSATSWTGSTSFSLSGVSGVTLVSSTNNSATSQTLVITTGSGTGTLTISDTTDSLTSTISVDTASLSLSPTSGNKSTTPTITLTGVNTLWSSETASGLFTVSGGSCSGESIGTPTVTSNTAATATLTTGSAICTITVTDASTTATASFTVNGNAAASAPAAWIF